MKTYSLYGTIDCVEPVSLELLDGPIYLIVAARLFWWMDFIHGKLEWITLPKFIKFWKRHWDSNDKETLYTFDEYYGNIVCYFFDILVNPKLLKLLNWAENHPKLHISRISMSIADTEKLFGSLCKDLTWLKKVAEQNKNFK